jgi:hypothetical protein
MGRQARQGAGVGFILWQATKALDHERAKDTKGMKYYGTYPGAVLRR